MTKKIRSILCLPDSAGDPRGVPVGSGGISEEVRVPAPVEVGVGPGRPLQAGPQGLPGGWDPLPPWIQAQVCTNILICIHCFFPEGILLEIFIFFL